ncbi:hypothetical protein ACNUDN_06068 [Mycobacterium sp. smrl_JER01]
MGATPPLGDDGFDAAEVEVVIGFCQGDAEFGFELH